MHRTTRLQLTELNAHLVCVLCGGYLVDATTIIECLHSFCRTCIIRYLETSKFCPRCDVQVHKTRPYLNIRSDKTLQDLVYKLVPDLFKEEMKRRREFYAANPQSVGSSRNAGEERGEVREDRGLSEPREEKISLCLQHCDRLPVLKDGFVVEKDSNGIGSDRRYLLCPAAVTVGHLKKFIRLKFDLTPKYKMQIFFSDESLKDDYTLMDIASIYGWRRLEPLKLYYVVYDKINSHIRTLTTSTDAPLTSPAEPVAPSVPSPTDTTPVISPNDVSPPSGSRKRRRQRGRARRVARQRKQRKLTAGDDVKTAAYVAETGTNHDVTSSDDPDEDEPLSMLKSKIEGTQSCPEKTNDVVMTTEDTATVPQAEPPMGNGTESVGDADEPMDESTSGTATEPSKSPSDKDAQKPIPMESKDATDTSTVSIVVSQPDNGTTRPIITENEPRVPVTTAESVEVPLTSTVSSSASSSMSSPPVTSTMMSPETSSPLLISVSSAVNALPVVSKDHTRSHRPSSVPAKCALLPTTVAPLTLNWPNQSPVILTMPRTSTVAVPRTMTSCKKDGKSPKRSSSKPRPIQMRGSSSKPAPLQPASKLYRQAGLMTPLLHGRGAVIRTQKTMSNTNVIQPSGSTNHLPVSQVLLSSSRGQMVSSPIIGITTPLTVPMTFSQPLQTSRTSSQAKLSNATTSGLTTTGVAPAGMMSAGVTSARVTSASVTSAAVTSASVTSVGVTSAGVTSVGVTSAGVTSAGVTPSNVAPTRMHSHTSPNSAQARSMWSMAWVDGPPASQNSTPVNGGKVIKKTSPSNMAAAAAAAAAAITSPLGVVPASARAFSRLPQQCKRPVEKPSSEKKEQRRLLSASGVNGTASKRPGTSYEHAHTNGRRITSPVVVTSSTMVNSPPNASPTETLFNNGRSPQVSPTTTDIAIPARKHTDDNAVTLANPLANGYDEPLELTTKKSRSREKERDSFEPREKTLLRVPSLVRL